MRNYFICLISFALLMGIGMNASAQRGFEDFDREQNIYIQYRWQGSNIFERHSNAALVLRLTNESEDTQEIIFTITFYRENQVMFQSKDNKICLKPGQSLRGAPAGLRFMAEGISMDMIREEWFSWDVSQMEVTVVQECE